MLSSNSYIFSIDPSIYLAFAHGGKPFTVLYFDESVNAYALDPRFKEVREYLVGTYAEFLQKYDLDGSKLDFIDVFYLTEESAIDYENMDYVSLVDATNALTD